jgi:hypothetical protein
VAKTTAKTTAKTVKVKKHKKAKHAKAHKQVKHVKHARKGGDHAKAVSMKAAPAAQTTGSAPKAGN